VHVGYKTSGPETMQKRGYVRRRMERGQGTRKTARSALSDLKVLTKNEERGKRSILPRRSDAHVAHKAKFRQITRGRDKRRSSQKPDPTEKNENVRGPRKTGGTK